jgi:hypothetical protein
MKAITLENLKTLCINYDNDNGNYPGHNFEGESVWSYIKDTMEEFPALFFEADKDCVK